jgi:hypothetical protein
MTEETNILFQAPASFFNPSFWEELYNLKLNLYKLDAPQIQINCSYSASDGKSSQSLEFDKDSFSTMADSTNHTKISSGKLLNVNTIEVFCFCFC